MTEHAHNPPAQPQLVVTFNVATTAIDTVGIILLLRALAFLRAKKARGSTAVDTHIHSALAAITSCFDLFRG